MKKRLFIVVLLLIMLTMSSAWAAGKLEMYLDSSPMGMDAPSFYNAYHQLSNIIYGEGSTDLTQEILYNKYGLDTYIREGMCDVQVLYRLPNHEVIAVSCQMTINTSQDTNTTYTDSKAFGQTIPILMSVLSYLEGGENINVLQLLLSQIQSITMDILNEFQNFGNKLDPNKATQISNSINYQDWRLSYYFDWDQANIIVDVVLSH